MELPRPLGMILRVFEMVGYYAVPGAVVDALVPGGNADKCGEIQPGDVLVSISVAGGEPIDTRAGADTRPLLIST